MLPAREEFRFVPFEMMDGCGVENAMSFGYGSWSSSRSLFEGGFNLCLKGTNRRERADVASARGVFEKLTVHGSSLNNGTNDAFIEMIVA